jgi:rhodanese-related sulfurtransferase
MRLGRLFSRPYRRIAPAQVAALLDDGAVLLDVRESFEWRQGHAPRARHLPLSQLARRAREIPAGRHIITVCRSGHRSAQAARLLAREGHQVSNVTGGMHAWARAGLPLAGKGRQPGRVA